MKRYLVLLFLFISSIAVAGDYTQNHGGGNSSITTDPAFNAKGDTIYGTAGDTSAIMAVGSDYSIRYPLSTEATGWKDLAGVANAVLGWTSGGVLAALTSHMHADNASQFYGATTGHVGLFQISMVGSTTDAVMTLLSNHTVNRTWTLPDRTDTFAGIGTDNTFTAKQTFQYDVGLQVGATGVLITSDNDGAITLTGASAGSDEDLTLNLDDTANTAVVSSSTGVTDIDFSALNLVTTGTIQSGIKISSDADGMTGAEMTTAGMYGTLFIATGAGTWTLPTAVQGMAVCLMDDGTAHDLILDVQADDDMSLKGTEDTNGDGITNATGSTTGDFVCVVATSAGHWKTLGMQGTWTVQ